MMEPMVDLVRVDPNKRDRFFWYSGRVWNHTIFVTLSNFLASLPSVHTFFSQRGMEIDSSITQTQTMLVPFLRLLPNSTFNVLKN